MDLHQMRMAGNYRDLQMTVLYRQNGKWQQKEIQLLMNKLMTEVSQHLTHPEYLVLYGHHTKEETLQALGGGQAYTAIQVTGVDSDELPFSPGFV